MKLMAIDGNSIINRAYYGIRQLSAPDGTPTNAVYGFLTILQRLTAEEAPDAVCVTFDLPAPTFRHERYDGYKAQRTGMPEELAVQVPVLKDVLDAMNIPRLEQSGWEADDLLGAIAARSEADGWECVVVTGDKDSFQLISDTTRVKHVKTRMGQTETKDYTPAVFFDEYGFEPRKMVDFKALMGDSSDNIPGVKGVGEKTALELVRRFGGIADIYDALGTLEVKASVRAKLEAGRADAIMSYELAEIRRDAPIDLSPEDARCREPEEDKLFELFRRLGFTRFIEKYGLKPGTKAAEAALPELSVVDIMSRGAELPKAAAEAEFIAVRTDAPLSEIALALPGVTEVYTARRGPGGRSDAFDMVLERIMSGTVRKTGHDIKDTMRHCMKLGIKPDGWDFDTALAAYLLEPTENAYAIARLAERYCGYALAGEPENTQMSLLDDSGAGNEPCGKKLAEEAYAIGLLRTALSVKLEDAGLKRLFYEIELPLCEVLAEMEHTGFLVDRAALARYGETLAHGIAETEKRIYGLAGETFNIGSPKQLGALLFDKLMLPAPKRTKTGYSTNIEVLEHLRGKHEIIEPIIEYRELTKLKSTYADGLLKVIGGDGRIHTRFQMTVTATGRLSSVEPNLQNIPIRKEIGGELRKMFVADTGNVLVDADYSQIELRLLAHIAQDSVMREAFLSGEDIHAVTASQVFGVPLGEVSVLQRSRAKAVNFGIVYGISAFSLAQDIGVTNSEAKAYIDAYLRKYSGVRQYMTEIVEKAKSDGFVATIFGRRRALPELKSSSFNVRSFGERVALNMPIQGAAADIIKLAMIGVWRRLKTERPSARLILQVHDELIAECPEQDAEAVSTILREEMERAAALTVPLAVDVHVGKSWFDAK